MPVYVFTCDSCGKVHDVFRPMRKSHLPHTCDCGHLIEDQDYRGKIQRGAADDAWPKKSDFCGVHPDQIAEVREYARDRGVTLEFDREGNSIYRDRRHRKETHEVLGVYDRDAGYGDRSPTGEH